MIIRETASSTRKEIGRVKLAELETAELIRLAYPPFDIVVALVDGKPYAIEDACNHAGASLAEGWLEANCVVCPMHAYAFDMKTGVLDRPKGLCGDQKQYETAIEGDEVLVYDSFELAITGV